VRHLGLEWREEMKEQLESSLEGIWKEAGYIRNAIGPFEVDGWSYMTDRIGFLAIRGSKSSPPPNEQHVNMSREILALTAECAIELSPLLAFLAERIEREQESGRPVECSVFGRIVDARFVNKWLAVLPDFKECRVGQCAATTTQRKRGDSLLFEGEGWKLLIAGLLPSLQYPPTYNGSALQGMGCETK
jgi:hypothetical protein